MAEPTYKKYRTLATMPLIANLRHFYSRLEPIDIISLLFVAFAIFSLIKFKEVYYPVMLPLFMVK